MAEKQCERCDNPVSGHAHLCSSCFDDDAAYEDNECANCGGEGYVYGCGWDWQCDTYNEGEGTCLCAGRCEWCNPAKLTEAQIAEREQLRKILADALSTTTTEGK